MSERTFLVKVRNTIIQHCCYGVTIIHHFSQITPLIVDLYIQILPFWTQISLKIRFSFFSQEMSWEIYLNVCMYSILVILSRNHIDMKDWNTYHWSVSRTLLHRSRTWESRWTAIQCITVSISSYKQTVISSAQSLNHWSYQSYEESFPVSYQKKVANARQSRNDLDQMKSNTILPMFRRWRSLKRSSRWTSDDARTVLAFFEIGFAYRTPRRPNVRRLFTRRLSGRTVVYTAAV
jgi:hypothetical protein